MEGRVAVLIDGSPFALTLPQLFAEHFQSAEDYAIGPVYATFLRLLRMLAFLLSIALPGLYVALTNFHHALIPSNLLFTMAAASEGLPFPAALEITVMLMIFEILKEAGIRLPKPVGQSISIVGALVMGQAAIQAGLVGAPVVIVTALTSVATFAVPSLSNASTLVRWALLVLSAWLGGFGLLLGLIVLFVHLASLDSFGAPYLYPAAPMHLGDLNDSLYRAPLRQMLTRPAALKPVDLLRRPAGKKEKEGGGRA